MPEFYTLKEVASQFRVSERTVYRWLDEEIYFKKSELLKIPGGRYLFTLENIKKIQTIFTAT